MAFGVFLRKLLQFRPHHTVYILLYEEILLHDNNQYTFGSCKLYQPVFPQREQTQEKKMCFSLFYQVWPHSQWSSLICAQTDFSCCELCCKAPKNPEEIKSEVQGFRSSLDPPLRP